MLTLKFKDYVVDPVDFYQGVRNMNCNGCRTGRRESKSTINGRNLALAAALTCFCLGAQAISEIDNSIVKSSAPNQPNPNIITANGVGQLATVDSSNCDLFYILVSTVDGKVTALDLHKEGYPVWSVAADSKPLISSTLANIKMMKNGKKLRLIPSLDGALYQFDGKKVEAIPMSAETLLSSTFRLSDDSMIVGSKELKSFGINVTSGKLLFYCGSDGCQQENGSTEQDETNGNSVLVITRNTQLVRSVDLKSGHEKWNFSVGQHDVRLPPGPRNDENFETEDGDDEDDYETDSIPVFSTYKECPAEEKYVSDTDYENFLRLIVPEGRVVALDKDDSSLVNWEYKFESPIAKAWLYRSGKLVPLSLFDGRHIPTLESSEDDQENDSMPKPLLYMGSHEKLLYIQPSPQIESVLKSFPGTRIGHFIDPNIKVAWRPYLNTASVRTPIFSGNRPAEQTLESRDDGDEDSSGTTSLTLWHEEYPFDTGFFLFPEFKDSRSIKKDGVMLLEDMRQNLKPDSQETIMGALPVSLWFYWREVLVIVIITILVHTFMSRHFHFSIFGTSASLESLPTTNSEVKTEIQESNSAPISESPLRSNSSDGFEYVSRFASDFDCLHSLGKGGFGVVFEAKNKVDDQHYAVKRIVLPKSDGAKEKVLREVKFLAKLEHSGIVRYFNAWVESPPPGWQEERDRAYLSSDLSGTNFSPTPTKSTSPHSQELNVHYSARKMSEKKMHGAARDSELSGLIPEIPEEASLDANSTSSSIVFSADVTEPKELHHAGSSGEFSVHSDLTNSMSNSWSALPYGQENLVTHGFDCTEESKNSSRSSVPFSNYSSNSSTAFSHKPNYTDNDMTGDSVVFESSSRNQSSSKDSVVFAHSDQNNSSKSPQHIVHRNSDHAIDISLSSHKEDEEEEEKNKPSSTECAKIFLYIQMQLYRKDTLKDWLANNTLNRDRQSILTMFDEIVCAVDYVHKQGLMHRDLKPSNIFFAADGHVKVGDFGLVTAQSAQQEQSVHAVNRSSDKHTAEVGTTLYMSPEQVSNRLYDLKVDIFSMGLIFLELWVPFSTQMERIRTLQEAKKQLLPGRFMKELPIESGLVRQMTSVDPSQRPDTDEILEHKLFEDIATFRIDQRSRRRTMSERSS